MKALIFALLLVSSAFASECSDQCYRWHNQDVADCEKRENKCFVRTDGTTCEAKKVICQTNADNFLRNCILRCAD